MKMKCGMGYEQESEEQIQIKPVQYNCAEESFLHWVFNTKPSYPYNLNWIDYIHSSKAISLWSLQGQG